METINTKIDECIQNIMILCINLFPTIYNPSSIVIIRKLLDRKKYPESELAISLQLSIKDIRDDLNKLKRDGFIEGEEIKAEVVVRSDGLAAVLAAANNIVTTAQPLHQSTQQARAIVKQYACWLDEILFFKKIYCRFRLLLASFEVSENIEEVWKCSNDNCSLASKTYDSFSVQSELQTGIGLVCPACKKILKPIVQGGEIEDKKIRANKQCKLLREKLVEIQDLLQSKKTALEQKERDRIDLEAAKASGRYVYSEPMIAEPASKVQKTAIHKKALDFLPETQIHAATPVETTQIVHMEVINEKDEKNYEQIQLLQEKEKIITQSIVKREEKTVTSGGKEIPLSKVSQEDIDAMSSEEYDIYNELLEA